MIAQEPQTTRANIPEPSHIDWSTQTDPGATRSESEKKLSIHKNICILELLIKISLATGLTWSASRISSGVYKGLRMNQRKKNSSPSKKNPAQFRVPGWFLDTVG